MKIDDLVNPVNQMAALARLADYDNSEEYFDRGTFQGELSQEALRLIKELAGSEKAYIWKNISIYLDGDVVDSDEIDGYINTENHSGQFKIIINKNAIINLPELSYQTENVLFLSVERYLKWANSLSGFESGGSPFSNNRPLTFYIHNLEDSFGGPLIAFRNLTDDSTVPVTWPHHSVDLPGDEKIKQEMHLASNDTVSFEPRKYYLNWGKLDTNVSEPIRILAAKALMVCLIQSFYRDDKIVLEGFRHVEMPLRFDSDSIPNVEFIYSLCLAVQWCFKERISTRKQLLVDRLTLDANEADSFYKLLSKHLTGAYEQSKNKYHYIVLDRKNEYAKELSALLKDIRLQSDLFSEKARLLLNSLVRDSLAAILLIAVGLFSRFGRDLSAFQSDEAGLLFKGFSLYLIVSMLLQNLVNIRDLLISRKEMHYWSELLRSHMALSEVQRYIEDGIQGRKTEFYFFTIGISTVYFLLSVISWNFVFLTSLLLNRG